ncbi:MAG: GntR family transcriptional regulator [Nitriliruptoraceae bacterium]
MTPSTARPKTSAYEALRELIRNEEFPPGTALVETEVAQRLGVSRTPVREAFRQLEADGLVRRGARGVEVRSRSPEEILDIYEVRIRLEALAASTAARRASDFDIMTLRRLSRNEQQIDPQTADADAMVDSNRQFHRAVWTASHNEPVSSLLERLDLHLLRYSLTTLTAPGRWQEAIAEHAEIVEAIADRDSDRAGEIASHHFTRARDIRLQAWSE